MRLVIQRVRTASMTMNGNPGPSIAQGLVILAGVENGDTAEDAHWLAAKVAQLRIFADEEGRMNLNVQQVRGQLLVVSQFTLFASTKKGNRPGFTRSAGPDLAIPVLAEFTSTLKKESGLQVQEGQFGADMQVTLCNDGPVTIIMDSRNKE